MFYSIAHPELMGLLSAAEHLLALTGQAVEICPNYGAAAPAQTSRNVDSTPISTTTKKEVAP